MSVVKILGRLASFGIAKETTRGTTPTNPDFAIAFDEVQVDEKDTKALINQSNGVIEDSTGIDIVKQWAEGSWKAPITDKHFPLVLYSILGGLSSAANADASGVVYDHTITVAQTVQHQSLSLYMRDPSATSNAHDYKHALAVVNQLEIAYEAGGQIKYTANVMAKKGTQASVTISAPSENRFLPQHLTFKLASSLSGLTAASAVKVKSLKLKIDSKVEDDAVLGDIGPNDYLNREFMIDGVLEATWDDAATFKTATLAGTTQAMRIDLNNTDVTIGTSAHPQLRIDLAKVSFKEITRPWKVGEIVRQTVSFRAHYSTSDSKMITILATNLQASY